MLSPDWLRAGPVAQVLSRLDAAGHRAFVVGGAVRNALLDRPVKDFDVATSARPHEVAAVFKGHARVVPTGEDHGTMTVVIDGTPVEVTTFRRDVETDGRRAIVRFSDDIAEDAARRDFTMNALYLDRAGGLHDPTGGLDDLRAGRLRFIGDAGARIAEDYLRSLRFFRLTAEYGDPGAGLDADALAAIAAGVDGLAGLSAERVTAEITRLLAAPDPARALAAMEQTGVLHAVLPGATTTALFELLHLEPALDAPPDPIRRLAAMTDAPDLRLSKKDRTRLETCRDLAGGAEPIPGIAWRHGAEVARDVALLRAAGLSQPLPPDLGARIAAGAAARRPISARDLMPDLEGAALGQALDRATEAWIASDFALDRAALLRLAREKG